VDDTPIEKAAKRSPRGRMVKLFRVLVVGGAVLAAAAAAVVHRGDVGAPRGEPEDGGGGTPGW